MVVSGVCQASDRFFFFFALLFYMARLQTKRLSPAKKEVLGGQAAVKRSNSLACHV